MCNMLARRSGPVVVAIAGVRENFHGRRHCGNRRYQAPFAKPDIILKYRNAFRWNRVALPGSRAVGLRRLERTNVMEPTTQHLTCLQYASTADPKGVLEPQLDAGKEIVGECVDQGWLERLPDHPLGFRMYRTTEAGKRILRNPSPSTRKGRYGIPMPGPRMRPLR